MQANIADVPGKSESGCTGMPDMVQMMSYSHVIGWEGQPAARNNLIDLCIFLFFGTPLVVRSRIVLREFTVVSSFSI